MRKLTAEELDKMECLDKEDLDSIYERIREIKRRKRDMAGITNKYHEQMMAKFESQWGVQQAIRLVACALCGYSHSREVPESQTDRVCDVMEELYKRILGEE